MNLTTKALASVPASVFRVKNKPIFVLYAQNRKIRSNRFARRKFNVLMRAIPFPAT